MIVAFIGIDLMHGFIAPLKTFFDERKQYAVLFFLTIEEGADMTLFIEQRTGERDRRGRSFHNAFLLNPTTRRFCPNILPHEVGTPAVFGFAQSNGRSLTDNAPNVMFSIATNTPVSLGIGKESVPSKPRASFPYVPVPVEKWCGPRRYGSAATYSQGWPMSAGTYSGDSSGENFNPVPSLKTTYALLQG